MKNIENVFAKRRKLDSFLGDFNEFFDSFKK